MQGGETMNERVKWLRANLGLTQTDFGSRINISQNYVWMIEKGERVPGDRTIKDICRVFSVDEVWLRTGAGEPFKALSRADEITAFISKVLGNDGTPIQQAFITVLARTTPDEWALFENKLLELAAEVENIKKETDQ